MSISKRFYKLVNEKSNHKKLPLGKLNCRAGVFSFPIHKAQ
ncbi:hypothetical protein DSOL_1681 [Desulfosporosinus metallidurans]|uniref:Uncharacterized protein n=1 Tax=Desulfosporosinus metallidurans TaxID=1888891 RepID=A0A1Q8QYF2_9FIRM|nr:hypothetical protein DSOL_1681 [Desulfosporosinus metallidurans]